MPISKDGMARAAAPAQISESPYNLRSMSAELLASIEHVGLRGLFRYWLRHCPASGSIPRAKTFGVEGLSDWARNLIVIEVRAAQNFRYGFYGTSFRKAFGIDMTGANVDDLPTEQASLLRAEYRLVRRTQRPYWRVYAAWFGKNDEPQTWERLSLPLTNDKGDVKFILAAAYRVDRASRA